MKFNLMNLPNPASFLQVNCSDIKAMIYHECLKKNLLEYKEDVQQTFFLKYLEGKFKYNPDKASLSTFIYQMIVYTVCDFLHKLRLQEERDVLPQQFFDENERCQDYKAEMELEVVLDEFGKEIAKLQQTHSKGMPLDAYHQVFQLKRQEYYGREIAEEFGVSDMRISQILSPIREVASRFL
jgi:RNA polymerase sigma factor (sigma-70 family)